MTGPRLLFAASLVVTAAFAAITLSVFIFLLGAVVALVAFTDLGFNAPVHLLGRGRPSCCDRHDRVRHSGTSGVSSSR